MSRTMGVRLNICDSIPESLLQGLSYFSINYFSHSFIFSGFSLTQRLADSYGADPSAFHP